MPRSSLRRFERSTKGSRCFAACPWAKTRAFPDALRSRIRIAAWRLQAQGPAGVADAIAAFTDAIAILDHDQAAGIPDRQYLLAAVWMNLANARASEATAESEVLARDAALRAIALVADLEADRRGRRRSRTQSAPRALSDDCGAPVAAGRE